MDGQTSSPVAKALWQCTPAALTLSCVLLSLVPFGLATHWLVFPALALTAVFFWAINQPSLLPPVFIFCVGLTQDFLTGGPIGLWAFVYLVAFGAVISQRNLLFSQPFPMLWAGFLLVTVLAGVLVWLVGSFYYSKALNVGPIALQSMITVLIYPLMNKIYRHVQNNIISSA